MPSCCLLPCLFRVPDFTYVAYLTVLFWHPHCHCAPQQQMLASRATPGVPSRYEWVFETYEQLMLCKYNAKPHTGKNWDRTFTHPR